LVVVAGLAMTAIILAAISRRAAANGQAAEREGPWSLVYYVLVDWWIGWL
jgi:hypothetical protein